VKSNMVRSCIADLTSSQFNPALRRGIALQQLRNLPSLPPAVSRIAVLLARSENPRPESTSATKINTGFSLV